LKEVSTRGGISGRASAIHYEDVVADLEHQARRIIAHCGLDWDRRCLAFHQTERPIRTASATQVRQPIYSSSIGRWRVYEPFLRPLLAELEFAGDFKKHSDGSDRPQFAR
jgi:hypothetical protein